MASFDIEWVRAQFPALRQKVNGQPAVFFDGPGGAQVPEQVMKALSDYMITSNANVHGPFVTSERTDAVIASARDAVGDFLGCDSDEVVFGANMTTITYAVSRAIGRDMQAGDEIIVTRLDHDANITPWYELQEHGVVIRVVDVNPEDCTLNMDDLQAKISQQTKLVAVGYASNAVGTINDVAKVISLAHSVGAMVFVDATHYAPHGPIDVRRLDCDFLTCSVYKFFGPHLGILYGKRQHLTRLKPYKLRPSPDESPTRWETGTQNHEALAGFVATIKYLTALGRRVSPRIETRREALQAAMRAIQGYESRLCQHLVSNLTEIPGLTCFGITEASRFGHRTPTISFRSATHTPFEISRALGDRGIFTTHGNLYAVCLTERLGVEVSGGFVRIGLVHYNTREEVDRFLKELKHVVTQSG